MPDKGIVHVIDDDDAMRESLVFLFKSAKISADAYDSAAAFLERLPKIEGGCVVTDVRMPGMSGIDLLKRLRELKVAMPVIVITGHGDVPLAVEAMKQGAQDFVTKPMDYPKLRAILKAAEADIEMRQTSRKLTSQLERGSGYGEFVGTSKAKIGRAHV